ncbi:MAG TPA: hypothetical protein VGM19_08550 [Armatimonadota bacterium]|jgi:hypothetical protein
MTISRRLGEAFPLERRAVHEMEKALAADSARELDLPLTHDNPARS